MSKVLEVYRRIEGDGPARLQDYAKEAAGELSKKEPRRLLEWGTSPRILIFQALGEPATELHENFGKLLNNVASRGTNSEKSVSPSFTVRGRNLDSNPQSNGGPRIELRAIKGPGRPGLGFVPLANIELWLALGQALEHATTSSQLPRTTLEGVSQRLIRNLRLAEFRQGFAPTEADFAELMVDLNSRIPLIECGPVEVGFGDKGEDSFKNYGQLI